MENPYMETATADESDTITYLLKCVKELQTKLDIATSGDIPKEILDRLREENSAFTNAMFVSVLRQSYARLGIRYAGEKPDEAAG